MRRGDWIQTYTGKSFWPMSALAADVDIRDIAHALAMQCRFAGHCLRFYSVAEHSVHVAHRVRRNGGDTLWGLLHDAAEAYLTDVPRPVKPFLVGYKEAEAAVMDAICEAFGMSTEVPEGIKAVDRAILVDEQMQNMSPSQTPWDASVPPLGIKLQFWSPERAEREFLETFRGITQ